MRSLAKADSFLRVAERGGGFPFSEAIEIRRIRQLHEIRSPEPVTWMFSYLQHGLYKALDSRILYNFFNLFFILKLSLRECPLSDPKLTILDNSSSLSELS